jgi:hypothetical protein
MRFLALLTLSLLLPAGPVGAANAVHDEAELFSREAVQFADQRARNISDRFGWDVRIDAVVEPPEKVRQEIRKVWTSRHVAQILNAWALERAREEKLDGVYVLINTGSPKHVSVVAWPEARRKELSERDCDRLREGFVKDADRSGYDDALSNLLRTLEVELTAKYAPPNPKQTMPWSTIGWVILAALGLWLTLGVVRMRLNARRGGADGIPRGLLPGLLGGLFGVPAGLWIYDTLFRRHSSRTKV